MLILQEVQLRLRDLDLLHLLDLLDLDIMNTWFSVSQFNETNWTAKGIEDRTTSGSG